MSTYTVDFLSLSDGSGGIQPSNVPLSLIGVRLFTGHQLEIFHGSFGGVGVGAELRSPVLKVIKIKATDGHGVPHIVLVLIRWFPL
jgi:hypothetical protein